MDTCTSDVFSGRVGHWGIRVGQVGHINVDIGIIGAYLRSNYDIQDDVI